MKVCSVCGREKRSGLMREGEYICDDCLNAPQRTRAKKYVPTASIPAEERVDYHKVVIREDDEDGPVVGIPSDEVSPVSEAEIAKAREEHKSDPKYTPTNERTLQRIGTTLAGEAKNEPEPKPVAAEAGSGDKAIKAVDKGARKPARSNARAKAQRPASRRTAKAR